MHAFLAKKKKEEEEKAKATVSVNVTQGTQKAVKQGYIYRVQSDLEELEAHWNKQLVIQEPKKLNKFTLNLVPSDGLWKGHTHSFDIEIFNEYPIKPPKVLCKTKVYHPNIDPQGNVCLNILREDWKPVLTLGAIFTGLHFLFLEPNPDDPLDLEAADVYKKDRTKFNRIAKNFMNGNYSKY